MENELKTLKDIKIEGSNGRLRLKAEAVKWLKGFNWTNDDLINETEFAFKEKKTDEEEDAQYEGAKEWIKHFFNLTEEDLEWTT